MEKEPQRRYGSVQELAEDVGRFLAHEPILARAPGLGYRLCEFVRRRRAGVLIFAALLLALGGSATGLWFRAHAPKPPVLEPGLAAEIFPNTQFSTRTSVRMDKQINFLWPRGTAPADGVPTPRYAVRWSGVLVVPPGVSATLGVSCDDGARVLVDGRTIMGRRRPGESVAMEAVGAGPHKLVVEYWNELAGGHVKLTWELAPGPRWQELVPASALFHDAAGPQKSHTVWTATAGIERFKSCRAQRESVLGTSRLLMCQWV